MVHEIFGMMAGAVPLIVLVYFIIVVIFLTLLWRIGAALDTLARSISDIARDVKKLADKGDK
jgi:hypothetical protein